MAQSTFSVRMDSDLKKEFEELCTYFGMNMSVAINMFARTMVREQRLPFEVTKMSPSGKRFSDAVNAIREESSDMTLDEINEEISASRKERKKTKKA